MSRVLRSTSFSPVRWPGRMQDHRALPDQIGAVLAAELEELAAAAADTAAEEALEEAIADGWVVGEAELELARRRSGRTVVAGRFADSRVGAPVVVTPAPPLAVLIVFAGAVVSSRELVVEWCAAARPPRRLRVNFVLGLRS